MQVRETSTGTLTMINMYKFSQNNILQYSFFVWIDSLSDFANLSDQIINALVETGFTKTLTKENKLEAITSIMLNSVILIRKAEIDIFSHSLGPTLNEARVHPEISSPCLFMLVMWILRQKVKW